MNKRKSLFDIEQEYLELMSDIEDVEGELTPELEKRLEINKDDFETKMSNYRYMVKAQEADIIFRKERAKELIAGTKRSENLIAKLKKLQFMALTLFGEVTKTGGYTYKFPEFKVTAFTRDVLLEDEMESINLSNQIKKDVMSGRTVGIGFDLVTVGINFNITNDTQFAQFCKIRDLLMGEDVIIPFEVSVKYKKKDILEYIINKNAADKDKEITNVIFENPILAPEDVFTVGDSEQIRYS